MAIEHPQVDITLAIISAIQANPTLAPAIIKLIPRLFVKSLSGSYTVDVNDRSALIIIASADPTVVTLPQDIPVGFQIEVIQKGVGPVSFTPAPGVTRRSVDGKSRLDEQYSSATITVIGTNEYHVKGEIVA